MKKIMLVYTAVNVLLLAVAFGTLIPTASAASVTINAAPVACRVVTISGTASYNPATELLRVSLGGSQVASFTSGAGTYSTGEVVITGTTATAEVVTIATGVTASSASTSFVVSCGSGDPLRVTQAWGLSGRDTPVTAIGSTHKDEFRIADTCFSWLSKGISGGCMDIRKTDYYRLPILRYFFGK